MTQNTDCDGIFRTSAINITVPYKQNVFHHQLTIRFSKNVAYMGEVISELDQAASGQVPNESFLNILLSTWCRGSGSSFNYLKKVVMNMGLNYTINCPKN
jgi:hypothetical protein